MSRRSGFTEANHEVPCRARVAGDRRDEQASASTAADPAEAAAALLTGTDPSGAGAFREFAPAQQHRALLALQRTDGNAAVQRLLYDRAVGGARLQRNGPPSEPTSVNPDVADLPGNLYVDVFESVTYDFDYRSQGGNLSKWLLVKYPDGTTIDVNIDEIIEMSMSSEAGRDAMANGQVGAGGRIFPMTMNPRTTPRLYAAKQSAIEAMDEYNVQFIMGTMPAVMFVITMGLGFGSVPKPTRTAVPKRSFAKPGPVLSAEGQALVAELRKAGVKFAEKDIVLIVRSASGKIAWLEKGNASAGLEHIMLRHADDFARAGVSGKENVAKLVMDTLKTQAPVATKGKAGQVFEVVMGGVKRRMNIVVGNNGFVVTAHPL